MAVLEVISSLERYPITKEALEVRAPASTLGGMGGEGSQFSCGLGSYWTLQEWRLLISQLRSFPHCAHLIAFGDTA